MTPATISIQKSGPRPGEEVFPDGAFFPPHLARLFFDTIACRGRLLGWSRFLDRGRSLRCGIRCW